jgi:hypothetical protein
MIDDAVELTLNIFEDQTGPNEANASIDVVADTSGGDYSIVGVHGGDAADGKTVTPMDIRHCQRVTDDTGKMRHVHDLSQAVVLFETGHQLFISVDPAWHSHSALARDLPKIIFDPIEFDFVCSHECSLRNILPMLQGQAESGNR